MYIQQNKKTTEFQPTYKDYREPSNKIWNLEIEHKPPIISSHAIT